MTTWLRSGQLDIISSAVCNVRILFFVITFFPYNSFSISPSCCLEFRRKGWDTEAQVGHRWPWECKAHTGKQKIHRYWFFLYCLNVRKISILFELLLFYMSFVAKPNLNWYRIFDPSLAENSTLNSHQLNILEIQAGYSMKIPGFIVWT